MSTQEIGDALQQAIYNAYSSIGDFNSIIKKELISELESLSNKCFISKLKKELCENADLGMGLARVIKSDFNEHSQSLQNTFRATCFSTILYQNECRLLLPLRKSQSEKDYCISFFPITKVLLGNRMSQIAWKVLIEICHERNIPYIGVMRNPNIFEMQECAIKCEDCPNYTDSTFK